LENIYLKLHVNGRIKLSKDRNHHWKLVARRRVVEDEQKTSSHWV